LVAAAIFDGHTDIRGYNRESETIRSVMEDSLTEFRADMQTLAPSYNQGDNLDEVRKDVLEWESTTRRAASAA